MNDRGLLAITVPAACGGRLAPRLGTALVRGPVQSRGMDGGSEIVTSWGLLRTRMRAALPLGARGDLGVEAASR